MGKNRAPAPQMQSNVTWKNAMKRDWQLYLLLLIPVALVIIFCYAAYPGLRMVFMDYKPAKGYDGSKWVGMATFAKVFKDADFHRALRNSLVFNFLDLLVGFPMPIILALILNELRYPRFKKVTQTILYLPHFLSWVIIGSVAYQIFRPSTGMINIVLQNMGLIKEGIPFLTEKWHWAVTYLQHNILQPSHRCLAGNGMGDHYLSCGHDKHQRGALRGGHDRRGRKMEAHVAYHASGNQGNGCDSADYEPGPDHGQ